MAARAIAGGHGGYSTENTAFRRTGYPLLLSPIYWFTSDPFQVFRAAQVVGVLINALVFPLAYLFGRRVLAVPRGWALGTAFAAASLPAVVFYSGLAMTDAVLATFGLAWLLLVHAWVAARSGRTRWLAAVGSGLVAGFMYTLHVRGTMVVLTHLLLVAVLVLVLRRVRWPVAAASVVAAVAAAGLDQILKFFLGDAILLVGRSPKSQTVTAVTTASGAFRTIAGAAGQAWYLAAATLGIGAVGLVVAVWPLLRRAEWRRRLTDPVEASRLITLVTALVATCVIAAGSAASLPPSDHRINYFAYPRYIHFLFPVWVLVGLCALRTSPIRQRMVYAGVVAAGLISTGGLVKWRTSRALGFRFMAFDAPETSFMSWHWAGIQVAIPTLVALALFAMIVVAQRWPKASAAALAAVIGFQAVSTGAIFHNVLRPMIVNQYLADTPRLVRDVHLGPGDHVAEIWETPFPAPYNHMREVYWERLLMFHQDEQPPADANVIIGPWPQAKPWDRWDGTQYGFQRIAVDTTHGWAVWRRG